MAFKKVLEAMERDDWIIVTEMLDKGELSTEDINKSHDKVNMVVDILELHAIVLTIKLSTSHDGLLLLWPWLLSCYVYFYCMHLYVEDDLIFFFFSILSTESGQNVANLCSRERSSCLSGSTSAGRS